MFGIVNLLFHMFSASICPACHAPPSMSGKFGGRIKGAKYRFTLQDGTWDFPGATREAPCKKLKWLASGHSGD